MQALFIGVVPSPRGLPAQDKLIKEWREEGFERPFHISKSLSATGYSATLTAHSRRCSISASTYGLSDSGETCPTIEVTTPHSTPRLRRYVTRWWRSTLSPRVPPPTRTPALSKIFPT